MNVLIIGGGGREHAIAQALRKSKQIHKLFASPGNPGIASLAECIEIDMLCATDVLEQCRNYDIELVVIGPEMPIANGLSDALRT